MLRGVHEMIRSSGRQQRKAQEAQLESCWGSIVEYVDNGKGGPLPSNYKTWIGTWLASSGNKKRRLPMTVQIARSEEKPTWEYLLAFRFGHYRSKTIFELEIVETEKKKGGGVVTWKEKCNESSSATTNVSGIEGLLQARFIDKVPNSCTFVDGTFTLTGDIYTPHY